MDTVSTRVDDILPISAIGNMATVDRDMDQQGDSE
jgi:hypothetical protein